jgi:hypothetical protein
MKEQRSDLAEQYQLAGAGGIEPLNGGIKIRSIVQQFQGAFGKNDPKDTPAISIAWLPFPNENSLRCIAISTIAEALSYRRAT